MRSPNPPAPFLGREGGGRVWLPLPASGRGLGGGVADARDLTPRPPSLGGKGEVDEDRSPSPLREGGRGEGFRPRIHYWPVEPLWPLRIELIVLLPSRVTPKIRSTGDSSF